MAFSQQMAAVGQSSLASAPAASMIKRCSKGIQAKKRASLARSPW